MLPPVVAVWTEDDVQKWLEQAALPSLKESFRMNNVNGDTLLSLSKEHFEEDLNVRDRHVLDQLLADGRTSETKRHALDRALDENRMQKVQAEQEAKAGNHAGAIKTLEQSTLRLKRTLQSSGVPIF